MKNLATGFLTAVILLGSCESFVTGINEDDITRIQDADLKLVLTAGEVQYMGFLEGQAARLSGLWSGYLFGAARQAAGHYVYNITASGFDTEWENVYAHTLKSLRIAKQKAIDQSNLSTLGICQVMEASIMGTAVALWGDAPYSEAANVEAFPNPAYEAQLIVIDNLILLLDNAIANLSAVSNPSRLGDFLYTSSPNTQWIAAANSEKARLLLYKKDYANALVAANGGIQVPANDLTAKHGTSNFIDRNMYNDYLVRTRQGDITASNTFLGKLLNATFAGNRNHAKTNEASRLAKYYSGGSVPAYLPNTTATGYFANNAPFPLHTAFETKLIAAECLIQTGDFTNALAKLNEHRANLRSTFPTGTYVDFVSSDFDPAGIENPLGSMTANGALLREILEEKYVCLYGQIEGFNEIRRTNNALGLPPNTGTEIPQRFLYSQNEVNSNGKTPNPIPGLFEKTTMFK
ncbi:MAG: SusD/RagB family nutrient-binding outer membrane lipoprotein [Cytophagales bacterium]|nr:SusD/RagB family nutrient-binding outer membrane lipoprotein [Cytophagales bacterium]